MNTPTCNPIIDIPPAGKLNAQWLVETHSGNLKKLHVKMRNCKGFDESAKLKEDINLVVRKIKYYKQFS